MDKAEAVMTLIREGRRDRISDTAARRTVKAMKVLGIESNDMIRVLSYLDFCDEDGTPYGDFKRIW